MALSPYSYSSQFCSTLLSSESHLELIGPIQSKTALEDHEIKSLKEALLKVKNSGEVELFRIEDILKDHRPYSKDSIWSKKFWSFFLLDSHVQSEETLRWKWITYLTLQELSKNKIANDTKGFEGWYKRVKFGVKKAGLFLLFPHVPEIDLIRESSYRKQAMLNENISDFLESVTLVYGNKPIQSARLHKSVRALNTMMAVVFVVFTANFIDTNAYPILTSKEQLLSDLMTDINDEFYALEQRYMTPEEEQFLRKGYSDLSKMRLFLDSK